MKNLIKGASIYLRKLKASDASERYCKWLNDPEVNEYLETRKATIEDLKSYIEEKNKDEDCWFYGIFDLENDIHIGNIKLELINVNEKDSKLGILIGEKVYWNKGIGTEATRLLVKYAFDQLKMNRIHLGVISANKSAIKVYQKVGFTIKERILNCVEHKGIIYNNIIMEIKKGE